MCAALPGVAVLGENLFTLRRVLLTDPSLQPVVVTGEAAERSRLVLAQLDRVRLRAALPDEAAFFAQLQLVYRVERLTAVDVAALARLRELFARTTQCNTTGRVFSEAELLEIIGCQDGRVFALWMRDRLADHGLVGAAVVRSGEILNVVLSCRVIGLGGEARLLAAIGADPGQGVHALVGRIVPTERNLPVRTLFATNGFAPSCDGWALTLQGAPEPVA